MKKGRESNWPFDSRPLKVENHLDFLTCRWCATYHWNFFDKRYNFVLDFVSIKCVHTKLWGPKVVRILILAILGLPLKNPRTKCHLDMGLVEKHRVYYKGEGGDFPQVRAMGSLVNPNCPWFVLAPKVLQLCTNHLVLVLHRFM
jgi:hypothetical protein